MLDVEIINPIHYCASVTMIINLTKSNISLVMLEEYFKSAETPKIKSKRLMQ